MVEGGRGNLLGQAWLVLCLSLVFGASLAAVEIGLKSRIVENKRNETYGQIPSLVPGATRRHGCAGDGGGVKSHVAIY